MLWWSNWPGAQVWFLLVPTSLYKHQYDKLMQPNYGHNKDMEDNKNKQLCRIKLIRMFFFLKIHRIQIELLNCPPYLGEVLYKTAKKLDWKLFPLCFFSPHLKLQLKYVCPNDSYRHIAQPMVVKEFFILSLSYGKHILGIAEI